MVVLIWLAAKNRDGKAPADFTTTLQPSSDSQSVQYKDCTIVVPGGTLGEKKTLAVTQMDRLPPAISGLDALCPAFDVKLGDLTRFKAPILIKIPYDQKRISGVAPADAFIAAYFDEGTARWLDVPFQVDEAAGVVQLSMNHLTTVQCYYSYAEDATVRDDGIVKIVYEQNPTTMAQYDIYEKAAGRTSGDLRFPLFVVDAAKNAKKILATFREQGLSVPDTVKIYITPDYNNYCMLTQNVSLGLDIVNGGSSRTLSLEDLMIRNLTHELFHCAQRHTMGGFDYLASGSKNASFWMEATADYVANTGIWLVWKKQPCNKYEGYSTNFFAKSLFTMDGNGNKSGGHEYDAASFVQFAQTVNAASWKQLIAIGESYSAFPSSFDEVYGTKEEGFRNLDEYYRAFLKYALFNTESHLNAKTNEKLASWLGPGTALAFPLDRQGNGLPPAITGTGTLTFNDAYTGGFHTFTTNCDAQVTIDPLQPVLIYRCALQAARSYDAYLTAAPGAPAKVRLGKGDFVLVTQTASELGTLVFSYTAEPAGLARFTGKWKPVAWTYVTVEAGDAFWQAVKESKGQTKEQFIASSNPGNRMPPIHFEILGPDPANPTSFSLISNSNPKDKFVLDDVKVDSNTLKVRAKETKNKTTMGMQFDLTYENNQIKGRMRTDISGSVTFANGQSVPCSAFVVFDIVLAPY